MTSSKGIDELAKNLLEKHKCMDVLVNSAGIFPMTGQTPLEGNNSFISPMTGQTPLEGDNSSISLIAHVCFLECEVPTVLSASV